jgi:hypothetical protein
MMSKDTQARFDEGYEFGLRLYDIVVNSGKQPNSDMIAGMLTAIYAGLYHIAPTHDSIDKLSEFAMDYAKEQNIKESENEEQKSNLS